MRAWLFVLAVLATFHKVTQVASTEFVSSTSERNTNTEHLTDSYSSSSTLDRSRRNIFVVDSSNSNSNSDNFLVESNNSEVSENEKISKLSENSVNNTNSKESSNKILVNNNKETNEKSSSPKINEDEVDENSIDDENDYTEETNEISNEPVSERRRPNPEQLVEIEKNLLSLFGFNKRPTIDRSKIVIPEAMKKLYEQITGHNLDAELNLPKRSKPASAEMHLKDANTVRSFTHEESEIDNRFKHHHRFRLYFNISSIPTSDVLRSAELILQRNAYTNIEDRKLRHQVLVYDIVRPGVKGKRDPILILIDTKSVKISGNGTLSIDVMPAVERWLKVPKHNHGLLIHVTSSSVNISEVPEHKHIRLRRSISEENHAQWQQKQPLLMAYSDDGRNKPRSIRDARNRRAPGRRRNKPMRNACQRWPLYVDFSDVGWSDWIVAPQGYEAFYCAGECQFPIADHLNTTNHAIVQTLVNSIEPSRVPKACCVPTQLSSICMLYLDDSGKVVLKNYQEMTVVGCGCR